MAWHTERRTEPAADYDDSATERTAKYRAHRDSIAPADTSADDAIA